MVGFKLTQTSLKDLEKDTTCPARWKGLWLDKELEFPSNENMDRGKYFEYLCLGSSAIADDETTSLPLTSTGKKPIDQTRIEEQALVFSNLLEPTHKDFQGHTIIDSQVVVSDDITKGTIDFVTLDEHGEVWIHDLKLTKDATSTRSQYSWGNDWTTLDLIQLVHYADLYEKQFGIKPRVALWVFDYSPSKNIIIGEIVISDKAREIKDDRFLSGLEVIELYNNHGWTRIPSESECKLCTLDCPVRYKAIETFVFIPVPKSVERIKKIKVYI